MSEYRPSAQVLVGTLVWMAGGILTCAMIVGLHNSTSDMSYWGGLICGLGMLAFAFFMATTNRKVL